MAWTYWILFTLFLTSCAEELRGEKIANTDYGEYDYYDVSLPVSDIKDRKLDTLNDMKASKGNKGSEYSEGLNNESNAEVTTVKQFARYEVTELVNDIPDDSPRGPIHTNFTIHRPLNIAGANSTIVRNANDVGDEVINTNLMPNIKHVPLKTNRLSKGMKDRSISANRNNNKANYFDVLPIDNEYEEETEPELNESREDHELEFDFKEPQDKHTNDFHNEEKDIVSGFKGFFEEHKNIHNSLHKIVSGAAMFLRKLHKKSEEFADKFHKAVSKHKYHGEGDDYEYS